MTGSAVDRALATAAIMLALAAGVRWRTAVSVTIPAAPAVPPSPRATVAIDPDSLDDFVGMTADNDPFRLSNAPSSVRYDPRFDGVPPAAPANAPPRPQIVVRGIVGGPPWQAILDGVPGQPPGTIVRTGTTFDKLTIRLVSRDTVVVVSPDTTWKLTLSGGRS